MKNLIVMSLAMSMILISPFARAEKLDPKMPMINVSPTAFDKQKTYLRIQIAAAEAQLRITQIGQTYVDQIGASELAKLCTEKPKASTCQKADELLLKVVDMINSNFIKAQNNVVVVQNEYIKNVVLTTQADVDAFNSTVKHVTWRKNKSENALKSWTLDTLNFTLLGDVMAQNPGDSEDLNASRAFKMNLSMMKTYTEVAVRDARAELEWYRGMVIAVDEYVAKNYKK